MSGEVRDCKLIFFICPKCERTDVLTEPQVDEVAGEVECVACDVAMTKTSEWMTIHGCIQQLEDRTPLLREYGEFNLRLELQKFLDRVYDQTELVRCYALQETLKEALLTELRKY